jgi:5-methyltetrahydrofolate--homocysteine methyltransferase
VARFKFPRQHGRERLCLADYFRPAESGEIDVVAFQLVTVGDEATRRFERMQAEGSYGEAFYEHGLAVEAAEAVAQWMHRRVRQELGLDAERGKRYSWGYPACPDLEGHAALFKLLPADAIGMTYTESFQLIPEQSTAAIVAHHPEAKYYAVRSAGAADPAAAEPAGV